MRVSPMKVVLLIKTDDGGRWTLPHVDELRERGHEVVAVLPPGSEGQLRKALHDRGVDVVQSAFDFRFRPRPATLGGLLGLRRQLRALGPDVLHYHLYASALAARLAALGWDVAKVHMVPGPLFLESPLIRPVERLLCRLDDVTVGGSEHISRLYRRLGLSAHRTPAIPYGVDVGYFQPPSEAYRATARASLAVEDDTFVVVMVAYVYAPKRLVHPGLGVKGHDVLLRAWKDFARNNGNVRLVLLGGGFDAAGAAHKRELKERFNVVKDHTIEWYDSVTDVRDVYAAADVSVSPSRSENHGAAREAAAMGVPNIVTDAGALPETVDPASGWLVPKEDPEALATALREAHADFRAGTLARRGELARERAVRLFAELPNARLVADVLERTVRERRERRAGR